jgi:glucokinase
MMRAIVRWGDPHNFFKSRITHIIAGDIGGTKSWLVWFTQVSHQPPRLLFEQRYESGSFAGAGELLKTFMVESGHTLPPDVLCLALPGPVEQRRVTLTNLNWTVDADALGAELGIADVRFINDFQAAAAGVATLHKTDYEVLNAGLARLGATRVITGAGTGLGLAWMQADAHGEYQTYATEGGHIDFAPANAQQRELLSWMAASPDQQQFAHVSWERMLSGMGLAALYQFNYLLATGTTPSSVPDAAGIHAGAMRNEAIASAAVQMFADIYAAWIGNLALLYQPRGGLYIAGGMAIHLQAWFKGERFLQIAADKGRMAELVRQTPVYLITNPRLGVQGAMKVAGS